MPSYNKNEKVIVSNIFLPLFVIYSIYFALDSQEINDK